LPVFDLPRVVRNNTFYKYCNCQNCFPLQSALLALLYVKASHDIIGPQVSAMKLLTTAHQ